MLSRNREGFDGSGVASILHELLEALDEVTDVVCDDVDTVDDLVHDFGIVSGHCDLLRLIYQSLGVLCKSHAVRRDVLQGTSNTFQHQEGEGIYQRADNLA